MMFRSRPLTTAAHFLRYTASWELLTSSSGPTTGCGMSGEYENSGAAKCCEPPGVLSLGMSANRRYVASFVCDSVRANSLDCERLRLSFSMLSVRVCTRSSRIASAAQCFSHHCHASTDASTNSTDATMHDARLLRPARCSCELLDPPSQCLKTASGK